MQRKMIGAVLGICMLMAGCSGGPSHDRRLFSRGDTPLLLDSEIVIETFAPTRTAKAIETRRIQCLHGTISATVKKPRRGGEGQLSEKLYSRLWQVLLEKDAFSLEVEPAAADGGLYHLIRIRLGGKLGTFSAQRKANFFGFATNRMQARMDILNNLVRILSQEIHTEALPPEAEPAPK